MSIVKSLSYPWTWISTLINLLAAGAVMAWFQSDSLIMAAGLGLGTLLIGLLSWQLLLGSAKDYQSFLNDRALAQDKKNLGSLGQDLLRLNSEQGATQLRQFDDKINAFTDVLKLRFSGGEFTFQRYLHSAQQVHAGGLHNLRNLRAALESVKTIDIQHLERRLAEITDDNPERATLLRRRALHREQMAKAERLLVENEEAITALTNVTTELANTNTETALETSAAIEALEALAERTSRYAAS
ncbi:MAG: hypothetical protein ACPG4N_01140 [Gammaproteobacteria bacterium]